MPQATGDRFISFHDLKRGRENCKDLKCSLHPMMVYSGILLLKGNRGSEKYFVGRRGKTSVGKRKRGGARKTGARKKRCLEICRRLWSGRNIVLMESGTKNRGSITWIAEAIIGHKKSTGRRLNNLPSRGNGNKGHMANARAAPRDAKEAQTRGVTYGSST